MSSIHFFIIIFFFFLFKIANFDEIKTEAEKAEFNEDEDREYKFSKYFSDGSCAVIIRGGNIFFFDWALFFEGGGSNEK